MKLFLQMFVAIILVILGCVAPPEYSDGLLENIPAIVNEDDYFSLSILGDEYTEEKEWDLLLSATSTEILLTTLIVKDLNLTNSDSSSLSIINDLGTIILNLDIQNEINFFSQDSVSNIGIPKKVIFEGEKFTGRIEYQIIKN